MPEKDNAKTAGARQKRTAKKGDKIKVQYTGSFDNGEVFDSSEGNRPLEFTIGDGRLIKGFDEAVLGMSVGEEKNVKIQPEDGYGPRFEELVQEVPLGNLKDSGQFKEGMVLTLRGRQGETINAVVTKLDAQKMTLDLNHPLAGKNINFRIKLVGIE